ncbi:MAG: ATP-binding protein [Desulfobulbus sp.]|nr:ATP-binding protein [Desulfobulbus sp.]
MLRSLLRFFAPVTSSEQEVRRHILWWIALRVALFTLLLSIAAYFREIGPAAILPPIQLTSFFLLGIYAFSVLSALILPESSWSARRFGVVQLLFDLLCNAALVYGTGCSQSDFIALMILPVITGGLILYRIGALFLAAASTLLLGGVFFLEQLGFIPAYFLGTVYKTPTNALASANLFSIYGLLFFLSALLSGHLARRLRVTEEKLSRTSLEYDRLSSLYKQIFDDISTGIITTDSSDFITSFNRAAERITGHSREAILGQPFTRVFTGLRLQEKQGRSVCDYARKDGTQIRLGYSFSFLNTPGEREEEESWAKGKVITLQDISQIERMENQVREAEKMAAIGELSASIAHDFRNPLAAISGSAQILVMEQQPLENLDDATFKTLLGIILRESNRMAQTITDFLQFARPATVQNEWFNLLRLVNEVIARLQSGPLVVAASRIQIDMDEHLSCWADRQQVQTVLTHLLENACFAVETTTGEIRVTAEDNEAGVLQLEIRDQGVGIAPEIRSKILTPFFSSRPEGTGLGLAIVHQIIENHRGTFTISDNQPQGCIIRLGLPQPSTP